jgi:hypothetical protein
MHRNIGARRNGPEPACGELVERPIKKSYLTILHKEIILMALWIADLSQLLMFWRWRLPIQSSIDSRFTLRLRGARFFERPTASALLATDYFIQTFNYADKFLWGSTCNLFSDSFGR